eukprot:1040143_1
MLTLLFTILLTFTQSGKIVTPAGPPGGSQGGRRLLQNAAVPLPTATETANSAGNAAGAGGGATEMECMLSNKDPAGCAGRTTNMVNPPQNFKLKCAGIGSCASSTFNFEFTNPMIERIEMILMAAPWAGYGATIVLDSRGSTGVPQSIDVLECAEIGACQDLVVKLYGGATINDIKCSQVDYCQGCTIKECDINPAGIEVCVPMPCWGYN